MTKEAATIYDVAQMANVSIATVSRVLNGSDHVRPETRDCVTEAIKKLQYIPSAAARSLSGSRSWSIGLAYPLDEELHMNLNGDTSVLYTDAIIRGSSWRAAQLGYSLFACGIPVSKKIQTDPLQQLYTTVDGLILTDRVVNNVKAMRIAKRMHAVHLAGAMSSKFGGAIHIDNEGGIRSVVEHLAKVHGTRDFGFVGGAVDSPDASARRDAFLAAVAEFGGVAKEENTLTAGFSMVRAEYEMTLRVNASAPLPQAFVCANDQMAIGAMNALRRSGSQIGQKIAVTGFDDIPLAGASHPGLTTVRQASFELGVHAVNMVIGLLDGDVKVGTVETLPTQLVVRGSCGCTEDLNVETRPS